MIIPTIQARDGDQYPFRGASFTTIGVTYQPALSNYIVNGIAGSISDPDNAYNVNNRIFPVP